MVSNFDTISVFLTAIASLENITISKRRTTSEGIIIEKIVFFYSIVITKLFIIN